MSNNIATPVHRFFENHLTAERGLSPHTVLAYRDSMKLFLGVRLQRIWQFLPPERFCDSGVRPILYA